MSNIAEALALSRQGDVAGALALLEGETEKEALSMRFHFAMFLEDHDKALTAALMGEKSAQNKLETSMWLLRKTRVVHFKGELQGNEMAKRDLVKVIALRASDEHVKDAQRLLLSLVH